jgi:lipoteichoic acid synthase
LSSPNPHPQPRDRDRLFAAWLATAAVVLYFRLDTLRFAQQMFHPTPTLTPWLPLAAYQDLLLIALLSWISWLTLPSLTRPRVRRAACISFWILALFIAAYAALNAELYNFFQGSLTWQLLVLSNHLDYIRDTLVYFAQTGEHVRGVLLAPLYSLLIALGICWTVPDLLGRAARAFHSPLGVVCLVLYVMSGVVWSAHARAYQSAFQNPEWAFLKSLVSHDEAAFLAGKFPPDYLNDFTPSRPGATAADPAQWHPKNVVMLVGESLGAKYLELYGGQAKTPEMAKMATAGGMFKRAYVSCPYSDNAMAALFNSVYPYHFYTAVLTRAPELSIPGIATVLDDKGYRVAMIHSGNLAFKEQYFLRAHGFPEVHDKSDLPGFAPGHAPLIWKYDLNSRDSKLIPAAMTWIDADRSKPFFLVLWTDDTHAPYTPPKPKSFGVSDEYLNRYLGAAEETDSMVGQLARELASRGLLEDTLIVVTGDHGEQFGQHGHPGHGFSLYDEEVRVPLIFANPRLFPHGEKIDRIARQIDIAPTILATLGIAAPPQWQGENLFSEGPERRAYLFADFHFGIVDGNYKYIYDANSAHSEIYNLADDPGEQHNLSGDSAIAQPAKVAYERLAAWSAFQNKYLDKFALH